MSVQESLSYIQGGGDCSCQGPGPSTRQHVGEWVVVSGIVEDVLEGLVCNEVDNLKGNVHAELCGVAAVEGTGTLSTINSSDTVKGTSVGGVVHLETLLDNCKQEINSIEEEFI